MLHNPNMQLSLLGLVVYFAGPAETLQALAKLEIWQAGVLVASAFGVSYFTALAWRAILASYGHVISVWLLFRLTILAFAVGWAIPSGFVAGIPVAAWFLTRRGVPFARGLASFTIGRFFEITANALVLPIILMSGVASMPLVPVVGFAFVLGVVLIYLDLALHWRLARRTLARIEPFVPRAARSWTRSAAHFCEVVSEFFRVPLPRILLVAVYSVLAIAVAFVRGVLTSEFLRLGLTLPELVVMFSLTIFFMVIPFVPGAIGIFEGGIAGAFSLLGHSRADGLAYAMTVHATELAVVVAGVLVVAEFGVGVVRVPRTAQV